MPPDVAHPLREIALRLNRFREFRSSRPIADAALLSLLKGGKLTAKIQYPGRQEIWVPISVGHWANVDSDQIRSLRRGKGKNLIGNYKIETSSVSEELARELLKIADQNKADPEIRIAGIAEEIKRVLAASGHHEAVVFESEWREFVKAEGLVEAGEPRGRREKTSWAKLSPIIGAFFLERGKNPPDIPDKDEQIAAAILELADKEDIKDLPDRDTLRGVISKILSRSEKE